MKRLMAIFSFFIAFIVANDAHGDMIMRDLNEMNKEIQVCENARMDFAKFTRDMRNKITQMANDYNQKTGKLTADSVAVWVQDAQYLSFNFNKDFNAITHTENVSGEKCKQVVEHHKTCFAELYKNTTAPVSMRVPTRDQFPCLGRLYERYDLSNPDHRFHGK